MKIGITTLGADGGISGISQYLQNLIREFSCTGSEAHFELLVHRGEAEFFVPEGKNISVFYVSDRLRNPLLNIMWHQFILPVLCKVRGYDVLFLPAANRRLPFWVPCPTVGTAHDFSSLHVQDKYNLPRRLYIKHVLPALVRRLTQVITVSASSKRDIVRYARVPTHRITVTPLAADNRRYFPRSRQKAVDGVSRRLGIRSPYILYTSRIEHPGKNHVRLIHAFEGLKAQYSLPHQLVLAGGNRERAGEVHEVARQSAFAGDIVFPGFVSADDLPDLYRGADLFVFPSLYEGFGLPILEAMSCGVPVICSDLSSMPEVAGEAALLVNPYRVEAISEAMSRVLCQPGTREVCVQRGLERASQFNWHRTADSTLRILDAAGAGVTGRDSTSAATLPAAHHSSRPTAFP